MIHVKEKPRILRGELFVETIICAIYVRSKINICNLCFAESLEAVRERLCAIDAEKYEV